MAWCVRRLGTLLLAAGLLGCAHGFPGHPGRDVALLGPEGTIEVSLDPSGKLREVEYHVPYQALPEAVRQVVERELPGGEVVGSEKEYHGSKIYWEVTKRINGRDREVLFDAAGNPVEWELEIPLDDLPAAVRKTAAGAPGEIVKAEKILDRNRRLVAYHVKTRRGKERYKVVVEPTGRLVRIYRETPAEIEVPLP